MCFDSFQSFYLCSGDVRTAVGGADIISLFAQFLHLRQKFGFLMGIISVANVQIKTNKTVSHWSKSGFILCLYSET